LGIFQKGKLKLETVDRDFIYNFFIERYQTFEDIRNNVLTYNPSDKACKYCGNIKRCVARARWILEGKNE
jgi:hypothetical protein